MRVVSDDDDETFEFCGKLSMEDCDDAVCERRKTSLNISCAHIKEILISYSTHFAVEDDDNVVNYPQNFSILVRPLISLSSVVQLLH